MSKVRDYFGITEEVYIDMYYEQDGKCAICGVTVDKHSAHVDHDHVYNLVRQILCMKCNCAVGLLQDSPSIAKSLVTYLEKWQDIHSQEID